jgi:peptidoglycan/xylan/chitin deacetylase (PgdA/CDA1 family)
MVSISRMPLAALLFLASLGAASATPTCPNPDALGIGRTLSVGGAPEVGLKSYPRTLALEDHEVVLTFDDGPWPVTTPRVLDALKAQCVEATFFLIGRNAAARPDLVRREVSEGHSVGHHTWSHPAVTLRGLTERAALAEIDRGMEANDKAAGYGPWTGKPRVPFFRFPGFGDTADLRDDLKARGVAVFGADLWASDWIPMTPDAEFDLLMGRLRAAGRGIILLHDVKRQTADMLPRFLQALKQDGFHVVHVVPGPDATPTRPAPAGWSSETEKTLAHRWPSAKAGAVPAVKATPAAEAKPGRAADGGDVVLRGSAD